MDNTSTPGTVIAPTAGSAKPGWQTSEFWVHALTIIGVVATSFATAGLPAKWAAGFVVASAASYGISRGLAKMGN